MSLSVDSAGQISGLLVKPGRPLPTINSLTDLDTALKQLGINASVSIFRISGTGKDARCVPVHSYGDQGAHPLGSMFKLYVLGAGCRRWPTASCPGTSSWLSAMR